MSDRMDRVCKACGQIIPSTAKLTFSESTPEQAKLLKIAFDPGIILCLGCRIHAAKLAR